MEFSALNLCVVCHGRKESSDSKPPQKKTSGDHVKKDRSGIWGLFCLSFILEKILRCCLWRISNLRLQSVFCLFYSKHGHNIVHDSRYGIESQIWWLKTPLGKLKKDSKLPLDFNTNDSWFHLDLNLKMLDTFPQTQRLKSMLFNKCATNQSISLLFLNQLTLPLTIPSKLTFNS